jgi:hypothetical protein
MAPFALCLVLLCPSAVQSQESLVNLALAQSGGMPTALASVANINFSAAKACDGKPDTGWVSEQGRLPVWLRIEWRVPVEVREVVLRQFPDCPYETVGPLGEYAIEVEREGRWEQIATGDAAGTPLDEEIIHRLAQPANTTAIRLLVQSAPTGQVAIGELEVRGPELVLPVEWAPKWQAKWIWVEPSLYIPHREPLRRYMRRSFEIDDPGAVREAWLLACAFDRLNQVWVNNRPALSHISYHGGSLREPKVREIPLDWLVEGENVVAAEVDDLYEVGSHGLLAELVLVGRDGSRTVIGTDDQWLGQEDQGQVPKWRKPGFADERWVPCRVMQWPNTRWHWLWNVPRPTVAPEDTMELVALGTTPEVATPGGEVQVRATVECARAPARNYALVVRLGQPSYWRNHDFELWGARLAPEELRTSQWSPGKHELSIRVPVPDYAPAEAPATLLLSTPDIAARLETDIAGVTSDAYGVHFAIPVDRGGKPAAGAGDFARCEVRTIEGSPTLCIDEQPVPPIIWSSSYGNYRRSSEYAATGVKLFRPIVEGTPICAPGEGADYYPWWFGQVDRMLAAAVSIDPEIRLLPAVWMDPNPEWLFDRPSEQILGGRGHPVIPLSLSVPDRGQVRPTFMSQAWRRAGSNALKRLVEHMRREPYAGNVIGLCFMAGRAGENYWGGNERNLFINEQGDYDAKPREEWDAGDFSMAARRTFRDFLVAKYGTDEVLQRSWRREGIRFDDILEPARFDREEACDLLVWADKPEGAGSVRDALQPGVGTLPMDYWECYAEAMADTFAAWGQAVKEASDSRLITGCYYGYAIPQLFTSVPGFHGHTAVAEAHRTPHLDFFVSPSEYNAARRAGGPYWGHNIIDSLRLHKKLWIYEQDTRTFLAEHMPKAFSRRETMEVLKRDASAALTRNVGWWYYEFAEGQGGSRAREWFIDPEIADFARHIRRVYDFTLTLPDRSPSAEIAVFYHGPTLMAQDIFAPTAQINITIGRLTLVNGLQRIGAPYDLYNVADIPVLAERGLLNQYRMCLFLNPFYLSAQERSWLDFCKSAGRTLVWLWAPGLAGPDRSPSPEHVARMTGIDGIRWLEKKAVQAYRISRADHPLAAGLPPGQELAALPFPPGATWERFGNEVWPLIYVNPTAAGKGTQVLGHWVIDGDAREDMGALCVRELPTWRSVYAAVPYLTAELMRNIARLAGVHLYRETDDVLFAGRHFVAVHTAEEPATGKLMLPEATGVYGVFGHTIIAERTDSVELNVPPYSTVLFYLGDPKVYAAAVEE